jgi:hypothetical protein
MSRPFRRFWLLPLAVAGHLPFVAMLGAISSSGSLLVVLDRQQNLPAFEAFNLKTAPHGAKRRRNFQALP